MALEKKLEELEQSYKSQVRNMRDKIVEISREKE